MDTSPTCALFLSGKTAADNETVKLLKRNDTLKLPDHTEISVFLHSERDEFLEEIGFRIDSYLNALSTNTFGRFVIWCKQIPSTQDIISHNFDLPLGTVCVADVQFKGRGFRALEELYYQTWLHSGQRVIVQEKKDDQEVENVVTIQGLTSSGHLLAIGDDSQMCELHPDGNSC